MEYKKLEYLILLFFILMISANGIGQLTFPYPERNYYSLEVMATFAIYLMFPVNIKYQLFGAILFAAACLLSLDRHVQTDKIYFHTLVMLINANILGYFFSRYYQRIIRRAFYQIKVEEMANKELSLKKQELKEISGIIPVCYKCNSVRDDAGFNKRLEEFIMDKSDVQFTHSMCPSCSKKFLDEAKKLS